LFVDPPFPPAHTTSQASTVTLVTPAGQIQFPKLLCKVDVVSTFMLFPKNNSISKLKMKLQTVLYIAFIKKEEDYARIRCRVERICICR
jgi:hypothetical protein